MKIRVLIAWSLVLLMSFSSKSIAGESQEQALSFKKGQYETFEGEVAEIEELREPVGAAIYTVKNFGTGEMTKLFADPYVSVVRFSGENVAVGDLPLGSRGTFIYIQNNIEELPQLIFLRVRSTY